MLKRRMLEIVAGLITGNVKADFFQD